MGGGILAQKMALIPMATDLSRDRWMTLGWALSLLPKELPNVLPIPARARRAPAVKDQAPPVETFFDKVFTHLETAIEQADLDDAAKATFVEKLSISDAFILALRSHTKLTETWLASTRKRGWITRVSVASG
jgi:hypothetical protein